MEGPVLNPLDAARRQQAFLLRVVRISFISLFVTVVLLTIISVDPSGRDPSRYTLLPHWYLSVGIGVVLAGVVVAIDVFTPRKKISTLFSIFFGLLGAILATIAIGFIIDLIVKSYDIRQDLLVASMKVLMGIGFSYLGISTVLQTQDDFRLVIPYVEFARQIRGARPLILDTSALIDGRFYDVASGGLVQSPVVVPRFVLTELQALADSADRVKRAKGRRGLELVSRLQKVAKIDVVVDEGETGAPGISVDQRLIDRAAEMQGLIVTTDMGLSKLAVIKRVPVINLHELAAALKPAVVAGEQISVRLVKPGEQPGQAVGYLDDGTMVVAEDGATVLNTTADLIVTGSLQTAAGRLVFAKLVNPPAVADQAPTPGAGGAVLAGSEGVVEPAAEEADESEPTAPGEARPPRGPFPPKSPSRPRGPTPRNPRR